MSPRGWLSGLRTRLIVAFALVTMLGAGTAAWSSAGSASAALVASAEETIAATLRDQIASVAPTLSYPPDSESLDRLRASIEANSWVRFDRLTSSGGGTVEDLVTPELAAAVRNDDDLVTQRVISDETPWLVVGTPILATAADGSRMSSGVEVFIARDLSGVEDQTAAITISAISTAALALPFAILLALFAARSVLLPVRKLRDTARRLKAGDLTARTPPLGADELSELSLTINEMAASLQGSMESMSRMQADSKRFAADVSHELRTPLSTLTAVVEVLADSAAGMDDDARESAELALEETRRLVELVENLMEVSRFDAGTARLRLEDVDVGQALREALRVRNWLDDVHLSTPDGVQARVDPRRLDVIVANLVGNAIRHGAPPVHLRASMTADHLVIHVVDNGTGLTEDALPHVFDRFYKADISRGRSPGSGLGLAIARENALLHGGDLTGANTIDGGARFTLRLPLGKVEQ